MVITIRIAEQNSVNLEFEASVCGGVPIIRSLKEGLIANKIKKIYEFLMVLLIIFFHLWRGKTKILKMF